jgi:23S rRNA pseudouridine2605 synthase
MKEHNEAAPDALSANAKERRAPSATPDSMEDSPASERLQKLIARVGLASRRAAEEFITAGRVSVNGHVIKELGVKADPLRDRIVVDGKPLVFSTKAPTVVLLHKPRGVVTTKSDPEKRDTVFDLLPKKFQSLHSIGRLDFDTAGVLLLTDDGDLTHLLTHPSHGVEKVYHARVRGELSAQTLKKLEGGVWIKSGDDESEVIKTAPCRANVKVQTANNSLVEIALHEGRNRQIRKMLDALGHPVSALRRVSFAGIELEGLPSGAHRLLLDAEVHQLRKRAARQVERAEREKIKKQKPLPPLSTSRPTSKPKPPTAAKRGSTKRTAGNSSQRARPKTPSQTSSRPSSPNASRTAPKTSAKKPLPLGERVRREWR